MAAQPAPENSEQKTGPKRDPRTGRVSGGNPGNSGGKKGRSGRKPGPFKDMLRRLRESPELAESLEAAVKDPESRAFPAALKLLSDYDEEKPVERKELSGEVVVRVVRDG